MEADKRLEIKQLFDFTFYVDRDFWSVSMRMEIASVLDCLLTSLAFLKNASSNSGISEKSMSPYLRKWGIDSEDPIIPSIDTKRRSP